MNRAVFFLICLSSMWSPGAVAQKAGAKISFDYEIASEHELKPHRRSIPLKGVGPGFNQLHLILIVSAEGDVVSAEASGNSETLKFWPQVRDEVLRWKFRPFERDGKGVTAEVEEYVDFVPPERLPKVHVAAPKLTPDSHVTIRLRRTGCYGTCPFYTVTVSTDGGILFSGGVFVVARDEHRDSVAPDEVRSLAKRFVDADFYSMDSSYRALVTDNPTYELLVTIDGNKKEVEDYVGSWKGMPAVITELENAVDELARTERWISGADGLVPVLRNEGFDFQTFRAQEILKEAASRGKTGTVRELLEGGVPLEPLPAPKPEQPYIRDRFQRVGWLSAASSNPAALQILIGAGASKDDQNDKDLAAAGAARSGKIEALRALIAYGANPNADLSKLSVTDEAAGMVLESDSAGSVLIYGAESGKPEVVREILGYHPKLEARDHEGKTALFAAGRYRDSDEDGARVECVRLLVEAGADVNARDNEGNTPLHETFLTEVEEELLRLGADVNARNDEGETPMFTTVDDDAIAVFLAHGADLSIRNNKGQTVMEAAEEKGPGRKEALRKAIEEWKKRQ